MHVHKYVMGVYENYCFGNATLVTENVSKVTKKNICIVEMNMQENIFFFLSYVKYFDWYRFSIFCKKMQKKFPLF
jgi:hypothetical protein